MSSTSTNYNTLQNNQEKSIKNYRKTFPLACNYNCGVCRKTNKVPNIAGRFFIINETQCQCGGCETIFDKSEVYKY